MLRITRLFVLLLSILLVLPAAAAAQETGSGISLTVRSPYGDLFRPAYWLPLYVTLTNEGADRTVELRAGQFATQVELPGGARKEVVLYVRPTSQSRLTVVASAAGTELASTTLRLLTTGRPLVGVVGQTPIRLRDIELLPIELAMLPERAEGLDLLDGLILDGRARPQLRPAQLDALGNWVARGGTLIISGGAASESLLAALPERLRPAQATASDAMELSSAPLSSLIGRTGESENIIALRLLPEAGARALVVAADGRPLVVDRPVGQGLVRALAFALDAAPLTTWRELDQLWRWLLPAQRAIPMFDPAMGISQLRDQQAPSALTNLPALDLPPLRWLLLLLGLYVVLVGPVSFLLLRRLDRLAWAWVSIPALTAIFALLTFGIGARQRGSDLIINQITVLEQLTPETTRIYGYAGVFSPVRANYTFEAGSEVLLRPLDFNPWGQQSSNSAIFRQDQNAVDNLRINQWSMELLAYDGSLAWQGLVADLTLEQGQVVGQVHNRSQQTLRNVALVLGVDLARLGDLAPGQSVTVELKLRNIPGDAGMPLGPRLLGIEGFGRREPTREEQIEMMAVDLAVPSPLLMDTTRPLLVAWLEQPPVQALNPLASQRVSQRHRAIAVSRPTLKFGSGPLSLDSRWLQLTLEGQNQNPGEICMSPRGAGIPVSRREISVRLNLPRELAGLEISKLELQPHIEGPPFINKLLLKARDWHTGELVQLQSGVGRLELTDAARFFSPSGEIQLRLELPEEVDQFGGFWGCFAPGLTVSGRLP